MLWLGLTSLAVCVVILVVSLILDALHLIVFGPCIGPGGIAVYLSVMLTAGVGVLLTSAGAVVWIAKRVRSAKRGS